jgi:probable HAF family extracellular repeat protein
MQFKSARCAVLAFVLAVPFAAESATLKYAVTPIGPDGTYAQAINGSGQVVGFYRTATGTNHPFLWDSDGFRDLGTLGGEFGEARGINDLGQVVGWSNLPDEGAHAFLYSGGGLVDLGSLGGVWSYAFSINNAGQIVGSSTVSEDPWGQNHAFLFEGGVMKNLDLPPYSSVAVINSSGYIGGFIGSTGSGFIYRNGTFSYLPGPLAAFVTDLNDRGWATGNSSTGFAFIYDGNVVRSLEGPGGASSYGNAINNQGFVVGLYRYYDSANRYRYVQEPYIYDGVQIHRLNDLIPVDSGWQLYYVNDINDAGQIVGFGFFQDQGLGYLLTPVPRTPAERIADLKASLNAHPVVPPWNEGRCTSLIVKLNSVLLDIEHGTSPCQHLDNFVGETGNQISNGSLSATEGQPWIDEARSIASAMGCVP